jgi:hypothetical protein
MLPAAKSPHRLSQAQHPDFSTHKGINSRENHPGQICGRCRFPSKSWLSAWALLAESRRVLSENLSLSPLSCSRLIDHETNDRRDPL